MGPTNPRHQYRDRSAETTTFVALKILTSQAAAQIVTGHSPEFDVFKKIETINPNSPGFSHCLTLRHCFTAKSPAGDHICFVTEPLSSSLANLRSSGQNRFPLPIARRIIKQVLLALDYLHRECRYIHTGATESISLLTRTDDILRSQIREHPCRNTPTSSFTNRAIPQVKPSDYLWPPRSPGISTFTSRFLALTTSSVF